MAYLTPNTKFEISGQNMNLIDDIRFGDIFVEDLQYVDTTGVSGTVPINAFTSDVIAHSSHGQFSLGEQYIILTSDDQVTVGKLPNISGKAGSLYSVTGENFYQITNVKFGEVEASFYLVDPETVEAVIPQDADYDGVTVFSALRTGLNNNQSLASGLSVDEFVPIPEVSGLSSFQLSSGEDLSITGFSLSGVTGVRFAGNDDLISGVTLTPNTATVKIPSGNIRGQADLLLRSGQFTQMDQKFALSPLATITGVGFSQVGISSTKPAGSTGTFLLVSGDNFGGDILYQTGSNYLGTVMGETGEFKLLSDKVASGLIPTGINIQVSGGDVSSDPTISSGVVSFFSDNYPESYPSDVYFTPTIGLPIIDGISPSSGVVGDFVTISGKNLYSITGVNMLLNASSNVGAGTYSAGNIAEITPGFELSFQIGNAATLGTLGESYDVVLSGHFGSVTGTNGFFSFGIPTVTSIDPDTEVVPGRTGLMLGTCLYTGAGAELWTGDAGPGSYALFQKLPSSGYNNTNHSQIKFQYPDSFPSGVNFKVLARNRRGKSSLTDSDADITALTPPFLSGFEPESVEFGDTVTMSGHFENIVSNGLKIGDTIVSQINQNSTTGFNFVVPENTQTNTISVNTSGGILETTGFLAVAPSKPSISGYYSGEIKPATIDYSQVFKSNDQITISGAGMDLVTGVRFSGESDYFDFNSFTSQGYNSLRFNVPGSINGESGKFQLLDSFGRVTESNSTGINLISVSGLNNYLLPAETLSITGFNITGMDILFHYPTGGYTTVSPYSNTLIGNGLEKIEAQVPTGITYGNMRLTGRENLIDLEDAFYPVGVITGITGLNNGIVAPEVLISITGINVFDDSIFSLGGDGSGVNLIAFSGFDNTNYPDPQMFAENAVVEKNIAIEKYSTGKGNIGGQVDTFYTQIDLRFKHEDIISGNAIIIDPWWKNTKIPNFSEGYTENIFYTPGGGNSLLGYSNFTFPQSGETLAEDIINKKSNYYSNGSVGIGPISVTGESFYVTGFGPIRGAVGDTIRLSGLNLDRIDAIELRSEENYCYVLDMSGVSSNVLTFKVPDKTEGQASIVLSSPSGTSSLAFHTGLTDSGVRANTGEAILDTFEVLLSPEAIDYQVIPEGIPEPRATADATVNYTIEETVNGTVFLVTRTKFPDGSTMVINSIPKP